MFYDDLLEHFPVEAQIRDDRFELPVLFAQLPELADLRRPEAAEAALPGVERVLVDAELADDLGDRRAGFSMAQGSRDLFRGSGVLAWGKTSGSWVGSLTDFSRVPLVQNSG